jgi:hypothetical protein
MDGGRRVAEARGGLPDVQFSDWTLTAMRPLPIAVVIVVWLVLILVALWLTR